MAPTDLPKNPARQVIAGRYVLGDLMAVGGMGEVFAGRDVKLDRPVAIKLLRREMAGQQDFRVRFEAEARAGGRLTHPGIVAVFDTGEQDGLPYMVMELLTGRTLADELTKGATDPRWASTVARQILAALRVAHREGILHRDLKPANILFAHDGSAKVADFGVAKVAGGGDLTQTGTMVGTPAYLAPERVEGEPASVASDLYAVGAILFEMLAGFKPFQADTPLGLMRAIGQDDPPDLNDIRPELDPALVAVVDRAMAKDSSSRFASAQEMMEALGPAEDEPTMVSAATRPEDLPTRVSDRAVDRDGYPTSVLPPDGTPPARTRILDHDSHRARHRAGGPGLYKLAGVAAAVLAVIVVVMMFSRNARIEPSRVPDSVATEGSLSPELDEALRNLEEAVNR